MESASSSQKTVAAIMIAFELPRLEMNDHPRLENIELL